MLKFYEGNVTSALLKLFPDISWSPHNFDSMSRMSQIYFNPVKLLNLSISELFPRSNK